MKLRANHLTISRIVLLPVPCVLIFGGPWEKLAGLVLFSALAATDWWDGKLARQQGPTVLGGLLDPVADKMFLAFTYLPMARIEGETGSGVSALPLWLVSIIFFRDLSVTSLRSLTAAHGVGFKTATLAKFKTAIQMGAGGFMMWAIVWQGDRTVLLAGFGAAVAVVVLLAVRNAARGRPVGAKIWTQVGAFSGATVLALLQPVGGILLGIGLAVLAVTVVSGLQYVARVWKGLADAGGPASAGELALALVEAVAPLTVVTLFAFETVPAWAPIAMLTAELATGGLDNLLATEGVRRLRWLAWLRSLTLLGLGAAGWAGTVLWTGAPLAPAAAVAGAAVSIAYAARLFVVYRGVYLGR